MAIHSNAQLIRRPTAGEKLYVHRPLGDDLPVGAEFPWEMAGMDPGKILGLMRTRHVGFDVPQSAEELAGDVRMRQLDQRMTQPSDAERYENDEDEAHVRAIEAGAAPRTNADGLRLDGPTIERWDIAGYPPGAYPPSGYAVIDSPGWQAEKARRAKLAADEAAAGLAAREAQEAAEAAQRAEDDARAAQAEEAARAASAPQDAPVTDPEAQPVELGEIAQPPADPAPLPGVAERPKRGTRRG